MYFGVSSVLILTNIIKCRHIKTYRTLSKMDVTPFTGAEDRFEGVTVDSLIENCKIDDLSLKLEKSLQEWENKKKRGVWFKVALEQSSWVPILAQNGFDFHHAKNGSVVMYKWLPKNVPCNIPPYAHTMIGVGAVVINDVSQVLVVREKYWNHPHWKLPGGYVEPGENIVDAAIREVYEETNIRTEFCSLLNFRHGHGGTFDCSDIYFVVSLKPLSTKIEKCDRELQAAEWLDVNEYLNHPNVHELNRFFVQCFLDSQKHHIKIDCKHGLHQVLKKPYTVYYSIKEDPLSEKKPDCHAHQL